jgi:hypothetical protein
MGLHAVTAVPLALAPLSADPRTTALRKTVTHELLDTCEMAGKTSLRGRWASRRLREEFENRKTTYYALQGRVIQLPDRTTARPDPAPTPIGTYVPDRIVAPRL